MVYALQNIEFDWVFGLRVRESSTWLGIYVIYVRLRVSLYALWA